MSEAESACAAAQELAAELGLAARRPVLLADWNNTIVRLGGLVAKVGTSHFRDARLESLERELAVAAHLAACGAPAVPPAREVAPGPHRWGGLTVTLWEYVEPIAGAAPGPRELAAAMRAVHEALLGYEGSLPDFELELDDARRLLHPDRTPSLASGDRAFLVEVVDEVRATLAARDLSRQPVHGSPHPANWLHSADGPLLLDFETACRGPVEWDLSTLGEEALAFFPDADPELIATLGRMRSVCVAAKCWVAPQRAPELREAAEVHLQLLRGEPLD